MLAWCNDRAQPTGSLPRDPVAVEYRFCVKLVTGPQFVASVDKDLFGDYYK